ncbi:hypothetical protein LguiB_032004 [Lonicera macranthoides]
MIPKNGTNWGRSMMEAFLEFHMRGREEPSPNAFSYELNHCKEEEKATISKPTLENKPETDEIEEIEVTAKEDELWVEGLIPSLQEKANEEVIVQVEELQVQALPAEAYDVRVGLKIDNVEHIDFIGVDHFDVHPNFMLLDFFNKLQRIALQYGLNFEEFCFARRIKRRRYSKYFFHRKEEQNYLMLSSNRGMGRFRFFPHDYEQVAHYLRNKILNRPLPCDRIQEAELYRYNPQHITVYYEGKPPRGDKTNWLMHEFSVKGTPSRAKMSLDDIWLDDWVLCKIYRKMDRSRKVEERDDDGVEPIKRNKDNLVEMSNICSQSNW